MKGAFVLLAVVGVVILFYSFLGRAKTISTTAGMNSEMDELELAHNVKFTEREKARQFQLAASLRGLWTPVSILGLVTIAASVAGYCWGRNPKSIYSQSEPSRTPEFRVPQAATSTLDTNRLRITERDGPSYIEFERREDGGFPVVDVSTSFDEFSGRYQGVALSSVKDYLRRLEEFDEKRSGSVILEGGEDFQFRIEASDKRGHLQVGIRLCHYRCGTNLPPSRLEGGFEFEVEYANQLFQDLHRFLEEMS